MSQAGGPCGTHQPTTIPWATHLAGPRSRSCPQLAYKMDKLIAHVLGPQQIYQDIAITHEFDPTPSQSSGISMLCSHVFSTIVNCLRHLHCQEGQQKCTSQKHLGSRGWHLGSSIFTPMRSSKNHLNRKKECFSNGFFGHLRIYMIMHDPINAYNRNYAIKFGSMS